MGFALSLRAHRDKVLRVERLSDLDRTNRRGAGLTRVQTLRWPANWRPFTMNASRQLDLSFLVDHVGEEGFGSALLRYLHQICGAEHCAILNLGSTPRRFSSDSLDGSDAWDRQGQVYDNAQLWRVDPSIDQLRKTKLEDAPVVLRLDVDQMPPGPLRTAVFEPWLVRERVIVGGKKHGEAIGLSIVKTEVGFDVEQFARLNFLSASLLSVIAKHIEFRWRRSPVKRLLGSVSTIEENLSASRRLLAGREAQVCARFIFGITAAGIAIDLGISEESVNTYKKRAFQRLNISCQRELLFWYLGLGDLTA